MSDKQYTIDDMVAAAVEQSPSNFQDAYASIVLDKIADAIEARKIEVAKNYFNYNDAEETTSVDTEEEPNEDIEATAGTEG
jgi:hypothetical protein